MFECEESRNANDPHRNAAGSAKESSNGAFSHDFQGKADAISLLDTAGATGMVNPACVEQKCGMRAR